MSVNRFRLMLWSVAAAMFAAAAGVLVWAAIWPVQDPLSTSDTGVSSRNALARRAGETPPLASFARAWGVDLRRPLTDEPRPFVSPPGGGAPPVRLVGTIVDAHRPRGIFITSLGQMELRAVGERAAGAEIVRIDERSATLVIAGQNFTLKIEKMEPSIPGGGPDPAQPPSARSR